MGCTGAYHDGMTAGVEPLRKRGTRLQGGNAQHGPVLVAGVGAAQQHAATQHFGGGEGICRRAGPPARRWRWCRQIAREMGDDGLARLTSSAAAPRRGAVRNKCSRAGLSPAAGTAHPSCTHNAMHQPAQLPARAAPPLRQNRVSCGPPMLRPVTMMGPRYAGVAASGRTLQSSGTAPALASRSSCSSCSLRSSSNAARPSTWACKEASSDGVRGAAGNRQGARQGWGPGKGRGDGMKQPCCAARRGRDDTTPAARPAPSPSNRIDASELLGHACNPRMHASPAAASAAPPSGQGLHRQPANAPSFRSFSQPHPQPSHPPTTPTRSTTRAPS